MSVYPKPVIFFLVFLFIISLIPSFNSVPFVVLYGLGEVCSSPKVANLTEHLSNLSGSQGYCIETVAERGQSWITPLMKQVDIACSKVKSIPALGEGYNIVALSQGNMVGRGVVELCDGAPPIKKFIGLAGPLAGIASTPYCGSEDVCSFIDYLLQLEIYSAYIQVQKNLAPSNFIRIPPELEDYLKLCEFLPLLSNELATQTNSTYKERFSSLEKLVLIMFENDTVMVPRKTSWFGYFKGGSMTKVLPYSVTQMNNEEWFPLKTLDGAGKIEFISVPGMHPEITESVENHIVPWLKDESSYEGRARKLSFITSMSSIWKQVTSN